MEHVRGWYQHKNESNILFLVFEELKQVEFVHIVNAFLVFVVSSFYGRFVMILIGNF